MTTQPVPTGNHAASDEAPLTVNALKGVMPKNQKANITPSLVDKINNLVLDPEDRNAFRQNVLGYCNVLNDPNVKMTHYLHAVLYVSYKLMGHSNQESWIRTFPDRYDRLVKQKKDSAYIRAVVGNYHRNKLVGTLMEQSMIPTWVVNADLYQKALNAQAHLMVTAKSEKVRTDAANSLLTHLKQPETVKMKLDVEVKQDDSVRELREAVTELALAQKDAIELGVTDASSVAKGKLINGESERIS